MNELSELALIDLLKKGKEDAYIFLVKKYNQRLFGYAMALTNDYGMSEDIIQNVFLRIWEQRKKLHVRTSIRNYLFKSVYNEFINQYKKKRSTLILEQKYFEALEKITSTDDEGLWDKAIARIVKEIHGLPPKCKEIFILSRKEGLTNTEIAEHLNVSIKTIEAQIHKAFMILRRKLGNRMDSFLFLYFDHGKI